MTPLSRTQFDHALAQAGITPPAKDADAAFVTGVFLADSARRVAAWLNEPRDATPR